LETIPGIFAGAVVDLNERVRELARKREFKAEQRDYHREQERRVLHAACEIAARHRRAAQRLDEELAMDDPAG
jgi:hypothetical protein